RALLERSSEELRNLRNGLERIDAAIQSGEEQLTNLNIELGKLRERMDKCRIATEERERELSTFVGYDNNVAEKDFTEIASGLTSLTLDNVDQLTHAATQSLQGKISYEQRKVNEAAEKMIAAMSEFLGQFSEFKQTLSV